LKTEQLEAMLQSLPQDKQIHEQKKDELLQVIKTQYRDTESVKKRKGLLLGLASVAAVFIIGIYILSAIQNPELDNASVNDTLDISKLEIDKEVPNILYQSYQLVTVELAREVIPYRTKIPANIPPEYQDEPLVMIRKWDQAGKRVSLEVNYVVKDQNTEHLITFNSQNFDSNRSMENSHEEMVELENSIQATFQVGHQSFVLSWTEGDTWYVLSTVNLDNLSNDAIEPTVVEIEAKKQELINMANEMKY
jgi:hypothetical protein